MIHDHAHDSGTQKDSIPLSQVLPTSLPSYFLTVYTPSALHQQSPANPNLQISRHYLQTTAPVRQYDNEANTYFHAYRRASG